MKIAILGWGSLICDPRNLQIKGQWKADGPSLPIEFARISTDGRLSLVLYPDVEDVKTLWAYSSYTNLNKARENLRQRECTRWEKIGFISIPDDSRQCHTVPQVLHRIRSWAKEKGIDGVIWTDLPSNFKEKTRMDFNEDNVIKYLRNLTGKILKEAENYIRSAPKQIVTKIRCRIEKELGWIYVSTKTQ